jgi:tRNA-2-methylthio-N6-dimethylallyladenosine synthase
MRGCDRFCSFCVVPLTRGREKSLAPDEILRQVDLVVAEGAREVTFLGQTVNSWHHGAHRFADLLDAASRVPGLARVRFTSPHPSHFDEDQFRLIAERPSLCPQIHLPVQSGSDRVLEAMKRGYTRAGYLGIVERLRRLVPEVGLTTDIITGFPGESGEDFEATLSLLEEVRFDSAFMFAYSPRSGTYAWSRQPDDVPDALKRERLERVIALQESISLERYRAMEGREVEVLVEGPSRRSSEHAMGRTPDGKTVILAAPATAGSLVTARIARANSHTLLAEGVEGDEDDEEAERAA